MSHVTKHSHIGPGFSPRIALFTVPVLGYAQQTTQLCRTYMSKQSRPLSRFVTQT